MPRSPAAAPPPPTDSAAVELLPNDTPPSFFDGQETILWLLAAGLLLVTGIVKAINLVIVLAYLLVGLWVINLALAPRAMRGLTARRLPRAPVFARTPVEWGIEIRDAGPSVGSCVVEERTAGAMASWLIVRSVPGGVFRLRARLTFSSRGKHRVEPFVGISGYPFGLFRRSVELLPAEEIIVLPKPARVDGERLRAWLLRAWAGRDNEQRRLRRVVDREAEIHGLRDYRVGDPQRRIHWKATARRNRLTVREYEDAAPPRLLLVVDPWLPPDPSADDRRRLEEVLSLAAGVCREWRRESGARLALVITGPVPTVVDGPPGTGVTERMLERLAVETGGPDSDVGLAMGELSRAARAAPALVVTARPDSPVPDGVGRTLGRPAAVCSVTRAEAWFQLP